MDNVVVGNLCKDPILWQPRRGGQPVARLTVAVNIRRRIGDDYIERPPVFHRVVCFGPLAENVSNSLRKGMEVLAVGEWVDDSYSDEHGQRRVQVAMEARAIGPALRRATAIVHRTERKPDDQLTLPAAAGDTPAPDAAVAPAPLTPAEATAVPAAVGGG
ncbi:MAG TPA: single-stranded DNA-binding protein [Pseudonocardiaceae bacterium]|nr:single-stranded DNA-binding protein [Pseudonocardiaceae bacterium]